jgi:uncharacterized protein YdhG (YjbR/CyaY superfamily)
VSGFDALVADADEPSQRVLEEVLSVIRAGLPDGTEGTSYGLPAMLHQGRPVVGLSVGARHLSLHPFSPAVVAAVAGDLEGYSLSKGTIRFSAAQPLPDTVVAKVVALRVAEIDGG